MDLLRKKHAELVGLLEEHAAQVRTLQQQAIQEIVPDVTLQLALGDKEAEWVADYLRDLGSLFRMFRRQKFIVSFTHEALREAVLWRLTVLKPAVSIAMSDSAQSMATNTSFNSIGLPALRCLPLDYLDNLGRPIAVLRVAGLDFYANIEQLRGGIILTLERMRVTLQRLNELRSEDTTPVLQYVIVLDVEGVSMKSIPIDLIKWYLRELQPWYYGIVGAAFIINYNWAHSGLWSILKHILPASAIAKVAFPTKEELSQFIQADYLPKVYEALKKAQDTRHELIPAAPSYASSLHSETPSPPPSSPSKEADVSISSQSTHIFSTKSKQRNKKAAPSRFSLENPFFGYPIDRSHLPTFSQVSDTTNNLTSARENGHLLVHSTSGPHTRVPTLRHGRRRKRDLVRALLFLYWQRWRTQLALGALVLLVIGAMKGSRGKWVRTLVLAGWKRAGTWTKVILSS